MKSLTKSIFIGLIFSFISVYAKETKYPDVWYRLYDWPTRVVSMIYVDKGFWNQEPVVISYSNNNYFAEGFFSKKKRSLVLIRDKKNTNLKFFIDKKTNKVLSQYIWPIESISTDYGTITKQHNDAQFTWQKLMPLDNTLSEASKIETIYGMSECEPLRNSIQFEDSNHTVVWKKSAIRYYRTNLSVPDADYQTCAYEHQILGTGGDMFLILPDHTILVSGSPFTHIVRVKLSDGSSRKLPDNLRIVDYTDIIKAKQQFIPVLQQQLEIFDKHWPDHVDESIHQFANYFFKQTMEKNK